MRRTIAVGVWGSVKAGSLLPTISQIQCPIGAFYTFFAKTPFGEAGETLFVCGV